MKIKKLITLSGLTFLGIMVFLYVLFRFLHFSTGSAALYLIKDAEGLKLTNDIYFHQVDYLIFKVDLTPILNKIFETSAIASDTALLDVRFNTSTGRGIIKDFRPDGSRIEIALSRFNDNMVDPRGLIIGGDFPPGDSGLTGEASGIAVKKGHRWYHVWCNANEGIAINGGKVYDTTKWKYLGARIIKQNFKEFIGESLHSIKEDGNEVLIKRRLEVVAGRDYLNLIIDIKNLSDSVIMIDYAYGDEPWLGESGTSNGDIGWYPGGIVTKEKYIDSINYNIAGFWDRGNPEIKEDGTFSGLINYLQWFGRAPTMVYFSNDFYSVNLKRSLSSPDNRLINLVWKGLVLAPYEVERLYLRIGYSTEPVSDPLSLVRGT